MDPIKYGIKNSAKWIKSRFDENVSRPSRCYGFDDRRCEKRRETRGREGGEALYFCMASSRISGLDLIKVK